MRIIPAIDLIEGKCIRLSKGDYNTKKVYNENPLEVAKAFEDQGVEYLHVVDLDGAKSKHIVNHKILAKISQQTNLKIDFGGGLKSDEDLKIAFDSGANQVTIGSIAANQPDLFLKWFEEYGADKIILGADCRKRKIATNGWLESSELDVKDFIQAYVDKGINYVICTDIAKDGMLEGAANALYEELLQEMDFKLIASGGVTTLQDIEALKGIGCEGVIIGKAIYEGRIDLGRALAIAK